MTAPIKNPAHALSYLLAGNAVATFRSHVTDVHYTYRVRRATRAPGVSTGPSHFVSVLTAPEHYEYLGCIYGDRIYTHGRRSRIDASAKSNLAFAWVWVRLLSGRVPETCDVYHEGRCGKCGRELTTPESIERGLGPVCAGAS